MHGSRFQTVSKRSLKTKQEAAHMFFSFFFRLISICQPNQKDSWAVLFYGNHEENGNHETISARLDKASVVFGRSLKPSIAMEVRRSCPDDIFSVPWASWFQPAMIMGLFHGENPLPGKKTTPAFHGWWPKIISRLKFPLQKVVCWLFFLVVAFGCAFCGGSTSLVWCFC